MTRIRPHFQTKMASQVSSRSRWHKFSEETTFHGFRQLSHTSKIFSKLIWSLIIATCSGALIWQTYEILYDFASEKTITVITTLNEPYPPPKFMIAISTNILLRNERQVNTNLPDLDLEAFLYARSIVETMTVIPKTVANFSEARAKEKFDNYLRSNNVTWAQALEPYILRVEPWLTEQPALNITRRLIWYPYTYYVLEPPTKENKSKKIKEKFGNSDWPRNLKDQLYSIHLDWRGSPLGENIEHLNIISYDLAHDNFYFRKGDKHKITFDIFGNKYLNLRRQSCTKLDRFQYRHYDQAACEEMCMLETFFKKFPSSCVQIPDVRFSLAQFYPKGRPCLRNSSFLLMETGESIIRQESPIPPPFMLSANETAAITDDINACKKLKCFEVCNQLTIKYQLTEGKLMPDQFPTEAMLGVEMPAYDGVTIFEHTPMLSIEALIAQWGGLAGLWLGASLMSFCEIIYFWCCCHTSNSDVVQKAKMDVH